MIIQNIFDPSSMTDPLPRRVYIHKDEISEYENSLCSDPLLSLSLSLSWL